MADTVDFTVHNIPGISEVVLREGALVSLTSAAAEVRVETTYPAISRIPPPPPRVSTSCEAARTWTLSGRHQTGAVGTVQIKLNKFLDCIPGTIEGTFYSNYLGSVPSFVATAEAEGAVFLSYTVAVVAVAPPAGQVFLPQAWDVTITVRSWSHDSKAAANIPFTWIAIARTATVTNF